MTDHRLKWIVGIMVVLVVVTSTGWALSTIGRATDVPLAERSYTYAVAERGRIGQGINLNVSASWSSKPVGSNRAVGIVTSVEAKSGDRLIQGDHLYSVNLRPVSAAVGNVPAFRPIALSAEGKDVLQLQVMLHKLGFYVGRQDGVAGSSTVVAIKSWQRSEGIEGTGVVETGDVVFFPRLPARVTIDKSIIQVGADLSGGEDAIGYLDAAPTFTIPATAEQAAQITTGLRVQISVPSGKTWQALSGGQAVDSKTNVSVVSLQPVTGKYVCEDDCHEIPVDGQTILSGRVITVEEQAGTVVPTSAVLTRADGQAFVTTRTGKKIDVTVGESSSGMTIVIGLAEGSVVRISSGS